VALPEAEEAVALPEAEEAVALPEAEEAVALPVALLEAEALAEAEEDHHLSRQQFHRLAQRLVA